MSPSHSRRAAARLLLATGAGLGIVVATLTLPSYGGERAGARTGQAATLAEAHDAAVAMAKATRTGTLFLPNGEHVHLNGASIKGTKVVWDPKTKNALARSGETAEDPTTPEQAARNVDAAAAQRNESDPPLTTVRVDPARTTIPATRYAMFNGCYRLQSTSNGKWLTGVNGTPAFTTAETSSAPLYFKAAYLGQYLLYSSARTHLARVNGVGWSPTPDESGVWRTTGTAGTFRFFATGTTGLVVAPNGAVSIGDNPTPLRLRLATGCATFPEASVNVTGLPHAGVTTMQETRGYVDAHTHGMAFEFLGGDVHCGRPWSPYGAPTALTDCPDHTTTAGKGAIMESFLSGDLDGHDPIGWPTFKDWPAPHSLTHEGTYYKWLERSWRGGQRVLVNLLVENNQLCELYPLKRNSCDDMDSVRLQARDMHAMERYIDAQHGGPGKGWYRIVTNPDQARKVINAGKMAVIMGIETSVPFGCGEKLGVPQCTSAQLEQQLDDVKAMGVSQLELVNKFDNALAGVAGDEGTTGQLVNFANFKETGSYWAMQHCDPQDPEIHDKDQYAQPDNPTVPAQDALFGAVAAIGLNLPLGVSVPSTPLYPPPHHCNAQGLSSLGAEAVRGIAKRHMLFDPDHMSVKARKTALDVIDAIKYPGVISSHSWSTPDAYPRIYGEKGFITPYAGDSTGFVAKWRKHLTWANPKTYWGFGYGADINGLGAQGEPRPNASTNPVTYPFTGLNGVKIGKQVAGQRVYDINKDGVAQYGLYPDWIEDLRKVAGADGDAIVEDMARGSEAYLQTWERAYGVKPNACTNGGKLAPTTFTSLAKGQSSWRVLLKVGQPNRRLRSTFNYCSTGGTMQLTFDSTDHLIKAALL